MPVPAAGEFVPGLAVYEMNTAKLYVSMAVGEFVMLSQLAEDVLPVVGVMSITWRDVPGAQGVGGVKTVAAGMVPFPSGTVSDVIACATELPLETSVRTPLTIAVPNWET